MEGISKDLNNSKWLGIYTNWSDIRPVVTNVPGSDIRLNWIFGLQILIR